MKNYNGIYAASNIPDHLTSVKSPTSNPSISRPRGSLLAEDSFTVQDLRHEYNRALNYIDKLKNEQNNLKDSLKMTLENKRTASPSERESSFQKTTTPQNRFRGGKDPEKKVNELEIENSDLKSQLDTALIRIAKLQREKHVLQERVITPDPPSTSNRELVNEIRSLTHEIKVLTTRMQELEEENKVLLKHKIKSAQKKTQHKQNQSLSTYYNYIFKLVTSIPKSNFARNCFDERFSAANVTELIDNSQFEPILLKAFKYITDLLININSLVNEEESSKPSKHTTHNSTLVHSEHHNTGRSYLQPTREVSESPVHSQHYQEDQDTTSQRSTEITPMMKPTRNREDSGTLKATGRSSESHQHKNALHKIVAPFEEPQAYKKPAKTHVRHYSSIVGSNHRLPESSHTTSYVMEDERSPGHARREVPHKEPRHVGSSYIEESRDYSQSKGHINLNESNAKLKDSGVQKCSSIILNARKDGTYIREHDDFEHEQSRVYNTSSRASKRRLDRDSSERSLKKNPSKPRIVGLDKFDNDSEEAMDGNTKRPYVVCTRVGKLPHADLSSVLRKDYDDRSRSVSEEREIMHELEADHQSNGKGYHKQDSFEQKRNKGGVSPVEYGNRSRSMPEVQDTIRETHESKENEEKSMGDKKGKHSRSRIHQEEEEEQEDDDDDDTNQQQMWERKRKELATMRRQGSVQSNASEIKGKEYPTFRVSFGRTESKNVLSPSPEKVMVNTIIDVPRKKRVSHKITKFDVITGGDTKITGYYSPKVGAEKPLGKFYFDEERRRKEDRGVGLTSKGSQKSLSIVDKTIDEGELEASHERE